MGVDEQGEGEPLRVVVASERPDPEKINWAALGAVGALGALVAAISYLILNSAYVEFYESIGVRPEDVGLDRLAILGRALGPALIALGFYAVLFALLVLIPLLLDKLGSTSAPPPQTLSPSDARIRWSSGVAGLLTCFLVLFAVHVAVDKSSERAERAENGIHVSPVYFMHQLFIDVSADYARIYWLDKDVPAPPLFRDPWLLYLGSNGRVAVFMACGTTVIVPANKMVPEVLTTKAARDREKIMLNDRGMFPPSERANRERLCARLKS